jgi:ubiquinone/menaquinone biosynthesis C-methylase UbiE
LDLGSGSGQPALLEAQTVGENGHVVAMDISAEMLEIARRHSQERSLRNIEFRQHDIEQLPFAGSSFDAVTARFCLMFVKSPPNTLREVHRVLRKSGHFAAAVWGSAENNPLPRAVFNAYFQLPVDDSNTPGPFRFGRAGTLPGLLQEAGFVEMIEEEVNILEVFTDAAQYVTHLLESSGTWGSLLQKLDPQKYEEALRRLAAAAEEHRVGNRIEIPRNAYLVAGRKP